MIRKIILLKISLQLCKKTLNKLKVDNILELGCSSGNELNNYSKLLKSKKAYGVDLSKKAILSGKKKFKNLNLLNISTLQINKIKINFDLIICGFNLYLMDRELIFQQFDLNYKKLNQNGFLLIQDFNPLFKHSNRDINSNLTVFKMSYDNFLIESGLFDIIYKFAYKVTTNDKRKFKSDYASITLYKKIDFQEKYPENI